MSRLLRVLLGLLCVGLVVITLPVTAQSLTSTTNVYVPIVSSNVTRPFGFETGPGGLLNSTVQSQASALGAHWIRLNTISWREAQPTPNSSINWNAPSLQTFEQEVLAANAANLTVIAIVDDHPDWAVNDPWNCSPIPDEFHDEYAAFMRAIVAKYSQHPYYVRYWELGNEPDVAVQTVGADIPYGCWGDLNDDYYGGERYGRMLKVVTPQIRAADPGAKVLIGGLLLDNPGSNSLKESADFFEGILRAGAAPYFDIVAFHVYPIFVPPQGNWQFDFDRNNQKWASMGGSTLGKISFLRQVMQRYGVDKPLMLNETGLRCDPRYATCDNRLFEMQANILVRSSMRAISQDVKAYVWYTLEGPGWQDVGLLDGNQQPRPSYIAMKTAIERLNEVRVPSQTFTGYGAGIEAYRFSGNGFVLDVMWSVDSTLRQITLPATSFIAAYTRDGAPITPVSSGGNVTISVGFENIYLKRTP